MSHANAALTPRARLRLARLIVEDGWTPSWSRPSCSWSRRSRPRKWADRYRAEGVPGMADRSARPASCPHRTPSWSSARSCGCDGESGSGRSRSAAGSGLPASTVHAVLVRCRINRLSHIDRVTGEPIRRYEHDHPGIADPRRRHEVRQHPRRRRPAVRRPPAGPQEPAGNRLRPAPRQGPQAAHRHRVPPHRHRRPLPGRLRRDPRRREGRPPPSVLQRAVAWFAARGVTVDPGAYRQRQLLPLPALGRDLSAARHHPQTHPPLPAADQRQDL